MSRMIDARRDVDKASAKLDQSWNALMYRLSPNDLASTVVKSLDSKLPDVDAVRSAIRNNPFAAVLFGAGAVLLLREIAQTQIHLDHGSLGRKRQKPVLNNNNKEN